MRCYILYMIEFQLKFGPEKIQKESCLSLIITAHFFFVIASDIVLSSHNCYMAKYIVQAAFLVWSIFLYLAFLHAAYKIDHLLRTMPSSMLTRDNSNAHQKGQLSAYKLILIFFNFYFFLSIVMFLCTFATLTLFIVHTYFICCLFRNCHRIYL